MSCDCCVLVRDDRSLKKNINDLSHKISDLASHRGDQQLMDQLSDELQRQQEQLVEAKCVHSCRVLAI